MKKNRIVLALPLLVTALLSAAENVLTLESLNAQITTLGDKIQQLETSNQRLTEDIAKRSTLTAANIGIIVGNLLKDKASEKNEQGAVVREKDDADNKVVRQGTFLQSFVSAFNVDLKQGNDAEVQPDAVTLIAALAFALDDPQVKAKKKELEKSMKAYVEGKNVNGKKVKPSIFNQNVE